MKDLGISFANPDLKIFLFVWVALVVLYLYNKRWRRITLTKLQLLNWPGAFIAPKARPLKSIFQLIGLLFLILALMGPQWGQKEKPLRAQGLDICVALDLSRSMLAEDIAPNRLQAAKNQLSVFIQRLSGDRVALVGFAGSAFMSVPLTNDHKAFISFMNPMDNSYISDQSTHLPLAVDTCLTALGLEKVKNRFEIEELAAKVILLITDGEDTNTDSRGAIERAVQLGVPIYSFAAGTVKGSLIPLRTERGVEYLKDPSQGNSNVISKLEEKALKDMAEKSGGKVYYLSSGLDAWKDFEAALQNYKRDGVDSGTQFDKEDRFQWPLWIAFVFLLLDFLIPELGLKKLFSRNSKLNAFLLAFIIISGFTPQAEAATDLVNPFTIYKNNKGVKEFQAKNLAEARKKFEEALADSSQDEVLRFNWASNRLTMSIPSDQVDKQINPKAINTQVLDEGLNELQKIYDSYNLSDPNDPFFKALNYQLGLANELKQNKNIALKHYYTALQIKPSDEKLDAETEEAIKRLLVSDQSGGGGGGGSDQNQDEQDQDQGDEEKKNPQYTRGQAPEPQFDGTDINEQQAKQILENAQTKENEVRKKNAQKESRAQRSRGRDDGERIGRGKQW